MAKENLILPITSDSIEGKFNEANDEMKSLVSEWMGTRTDLITETWSKPPADKETDFFYGSNQIADEITKILTHRIFNFQSKKKLNETIPKVLQNILVQINNGTTLKLFLLYNGGYRASPFQNQPSLIFEPDQTELMLLYQISLLQKKILNLYTRGIEFFIVLNNGVANWVNDIPISCTENYAKRLRKMIAFFGAENSVKIILQSEISDFDPNFSLASSPLGSSISEDEHFIVERFLGRGCSREEAEYRSALYKLAESKWAEDLLPIIASKEGVIMRQVAHPDMLSFRSFPGGAIRIQNGTFGFKTQNNFLMPKLITSRCIKDFDVKLVSYNLPWENVNDKMSINVDGRSNKYEFNLA